MLDVQFIEVALGHELLSLEPSPMDTFQTSFRLVLHPNMDAVDVDLGHFPHDFVQVLKRAAVCFTHVSQGQHGGGEKILPVGEAGKQLRVLDGPLVHRLNNDHFSVIVQRTYTFQIDNPRSGLPSFHQRVVGCVHVGVEVADEDVELEFEHFQTLHLSRIQLMDSVGISGEGDDVFRLNGQMRMFLPDLSDDAALTGSRKPVKEDTPKIDPLTV